MMAASRFDFEKFNGKNDFGLWKVKMKASLVQQGLWEAMKYKEPDKSENLEDKAVIKKLDMMDRAHSALMLSLGDRVLREVCKEKTPSDVWSKLESIYMTKSLANRLFLKQRLYSIKFLEGKGVMEQLDEFMKAVDDLESVDGDIKDEDKAIMLLNALPKSFDQLKDAILYGRDSSLTYEEVLTALKAKEFQKVSVTKPIDQAGEALNIKNTDKKTSKKKWNKKSKFDRKDEKETRSCHYCKKPGHLKKNCYSWKRKKEEEAEGQNTADVTQDVETAHALNVADIDISEQWIMDSACSFHMCPKLEWFNNMQHSTGSVLLGNNQICRVMGLGDIRLRMKDGSMKILTDVRYIPDIKRNLISLGALESKGCSFMSSSGLMKVLKGSEVVMMARRCNSLYYLEAEVISDELNMVKRAGGDEWHLRLGHVSMDGVNQLIKSGVIEADSKMVSRECEVCVLGKSKKLVYPTGKHTSRAVLDYAHSDIWGPAQTVTLGGCRYFFINS